MRIFISAALLFAAAACNSPPATQPNEMENVVDATESDPGLLTRNEGMNYGEGSVTPAERNNMGNALRSTEQPSSGNVQR